MYWALDFVFRLISFIPQGLLNMLSYPFGSLAWRLSPTKRNSTLKNLQACYPGMSETDRGVLARESMRHYVCNALEAARAWHWSGERLRRQFDDPVGLEHLNSARAAGKGVLVLVPHFGAWEFSSQGLQSGDGVLALYKPGAEKEFDTKMLAKRIRQGTRMAATNHAGLKKIYRELSQGGIVIQLPDQEPSVGQGRFVPFFGIPAWTGILAPRLAQKTACRILFAVCRRSSLGHYQMVYLTPEEEIYSADMDRALGALNRGVEACIEVERAQYLWAYKRFKTRPEGAAPFYS